MLHQLIKVVGIPDAIKKFYEFDGSLLWIRCTNPLLCFAFGERDIRILFSLEYLPQRQVPNFNLMSYTHSSRTLLQRYLIEISILSLMFVTLL